MISCRYSLHGHPEFGEVEVIFTISTFPIDGFVILVFGGIFSISIINDSDKLNGFVTHCAHEGHPRYHYFPHTLWEMYTIQQEVMIPVCCGGVLYYTLWYTLTSSTIDYTL